MSLKTYPLSIDYKEQKEWSKPQMWLEMAFGAVAGGLFIASLILKFPLGIIVALLLMIFGKGTMLLADLGRPERFLKVLKNPKYSWISKGAWGFILFTVVGLVSVAPLIFENLPWLPWSGGGLWIGVIGAVLAAFMMIYDGFFLGASKGVSFWTKANLPIVFGASAAVGGIGALMLLAPIGGLELETTTLALANIIVLAIAAFSLYSQMKITANGDSGSKFSSELLTKGRLSFVFWSGVVIAGLVLPLFVSVVGLVGISIPVVVWAITGLFEVAGVVFLRYAILKAGVYSPVY